MKSLLSQGALEKQTNKVVHGWPSLIGGEASQKGRLTSCYSFLFQKINTEFQITTRTAQPTAVDEP